MRVMITAKMPHAEFNSAVRDGSAGTKLKRLLEAMKPEAAYFTERDGLRCAVLVVDLADSSGIPALAEPWFLTFNADVHFSIAMTPEDLAKGGLDDLGKQWI
jgi:hypothetical protein